MDLCNVSVIKGLMSRHSFRFNKDLGQNFLIDRYILEEMADAAQVEGCGVIEIGPGFGTLTAELAQKAEKVVAVEMDSRLMPVLEETVGDLANVAIINQDILKTDIPALIERHMGGLRVKVAANLPYYITTPIVLSLLEGGLPIESITVMVQKEVARRMAASPGGREYGMLSVAVGFYTEPEILLDVPRDSFLPAPEVDSAAVRLTLRSSPPVDCDKGAFFKLVRAAFSNRRKTLCNSLANAGIYSVNKDAIKACIAECEIPPAARAETLSLQQFSLLAQKLKYIG